VPLLFPQVPPNLRSLTRTLPPPTLFTKAALNHPEEFCKVRQGLVDAEQQRRMVEDGIIPVSGNGMTENMMVRF
jgi:hypothetical protein